MRVARVVYASRVRLDLAVGEIRRRMMNDRLPALGS
jgi:hypothetical protein